MNKGYFHSTPDEREAYTIVIPPPNVTGVSTYGTHAKQYLTRCND